jgi:nucleoside-diphosphate-sugar epimerase
LFSPAFRELAALVRTNALGSLRHVSCIFSMPLRQLTAKQMSHWMFDKPGNLLLEQAIHPLSLIRALLGEVTGISATASDGETISPGVQLYKSTNIALRGENADAQLHFAIGRDYPYIQIQAICDDGVITTDMITNRIFVNGRTRFPEFADAYFNGKRIAKALSAQSRANAVNYLLSLFHLKPRSDWFYHSMVASIGDFHAFLDGTRKLESDGAFGADLVRLCEAIAQDAYAANHAAKPVGVAEPSETNDVVLLGGTGFIGAHTVRQLVGAGKSVVVMARNLNNLAPVFHQAGVSLIRGDITNKSDVQRAVRLAPVVVNLAHGGGGDTWAEIERSMVGSARIVGACCLAADTKRLVHVGSIAGLYLGDGGETITGATPPDPSSGARGDYARGKAESDFALLKMFRDDDLPVCILRPGVVVGEGTSPFHSGLGFYNNDQYCMGWNLGDNPLPFVLAGDVASAIAASLTATAIDGKCFNLVGDVRLTAREYIRELATATNRPLNFYPQSIHKLFSVEIGKWVIKRLIGRNAPFPSLRDLKSRGMVARFDNSDAKADLGWEPVSDLKEFFTATIQGAAPPATSS